VALALEIAFAAALGLVAASLVAVAFARVPERVLLGAAVVSLALGYWLLSKGSTTLAPVLLVLGYCVLFPVGLAL